MARTLGRPATLDDIPDSELDRLAALGFDWIWFLSVWQTGPGAQQSPATIPSGGVNSRRRYRICARKTSPAPALRLPATRCIRISGETLHWPASRAAPYARLRLMLDFVPNHMGLDHPWIEDHPDYFIQGTEHDLASAPQNYTRVQRRAGDLILAYGRDPYFSGWPDTLQLNYANPALQEAMIGELVKIAGQCDGVRCDMAMLILPDVFQPPGASVPRSSGRRRLSVCVNAFPVFSSWPRFTGTWNGRSSSKASITPMTNDSTIAFARVMPVLWRAFPGGLDYQDKLARFLENHDEPRAAATFSPEIHQAAAVITFLSPGLRFFHQGQFEGRQKRISPHLVRGPSEPAKTSGWNDFTNDQLLAVLRQPVVRDGQWQLLACVPPAGKAIGPAIALWLLPGKAPVESG